MTPPKKGERWGELETEDREESDSKVRTSEAQEGMDTQAKPLSMGMNLTQEAHTGRHAHCSEAQGVLSYPLMESLVLPGLLRRSGLLGTGSPVPIHCPVHETSTGAQKRKRPKSSVFTLVTPNWI